MFRLIPTFLLLLPLAACELNQFTRENPLDAVPPGCDVAKFRLHQQRLKFAEGLGQSLKSGPERPPVAEGEAIPFGEILIVSPKGFSNGFQSSKQFFIVKESQAYIRWSTDAGDECFGYEGVNKYSYSTEQMTSLNESLEKTLRVADPGLPDCAVKSEGFISYDGSQTLSFYFADGSRSTYMILDDTACRTAATMHMPLISSEFLKVKALLSDSLIDEQSPYSP